MSAPTTDRIALAPAVTLAAAGLAGGVAMPLLVAVETRPLVATAAVLFACHGALAGVTVMAAAWLVYYRLCQRRTWNAPCTALVALAAGGLWFFPLVPRSVDGLLFYADPSHWLLAAQAARDPALLVLAAYFQCWPLACLAVWLGCWLSGQAAGWWRLRGWWPQWLAMWLLAIWSLPSVCIAWQMGWNYLRPHYLVIPS